MVAWVHDEVQVEVPEKYGTMVGEIVVKAAADAGEILKFRCPVGAEFKIGKNWYDCH
jgi:DNA polymerase-1